MEVGRESAPVLLMGLDQYAYSREQRDRDEKMEFNGEQFYWRKHSKLQAFMESVANEREGMSPTDLNCSELELFEDEIIQLQELVKGNSLPESFGGFFYGHQYQDETAEDCREQDLEFCKWALAEMKDGNYVFYSCWW
jgi:predicted TIM-barrel fold metal-dependent hydrolase